MHRHVVRASSDRNPDFPEATRFTVTRRGASIARTLLAPSAPPNSPDAHSPRLRSITSNEPVWDHAEGDLWFRGQLVRHFRKAVSLQRTLLDAFQKQGSPESLPDPLLQAGERGVRFRCRLHDTVKYLNRGQMTPFLQFFLADGGHAVGWKRRKRPGESTPIYP